MRKLTSLEILRDIAHVWNLLHQDTQEFLSELIAGESEVSKQLLKSSIEEIKELKNVEEWYEIK